MQRDGAQTKILSCSQDLKMTRIQTSRGVEQIDGACRSLADLNKILRDRNRQYSVQSMKARREPVKEIMHEDEVCFGRLMTKIRMEQEELVIALQKKNRETDKEVERKSLTLLQSASQ